MRHKLKEVARKPTEEKECRHYWIIEGAKGPISRGVCKFCGAEREFRNSWPPDSSYAGRDSRVFELPNLLEVESDKEPEDSEAEKSNANL
ncbi:MAG: hypothetical protein ACE5KP_06410 [Dehalococcoidales bacterium]